MRLPLALRTWIRGRCPSRRHSSRRTIGGIRSLEVLEQRVLPAHYFVDAANGSDANPGNADAPFATYLPLVYAYGQTDPNIGRVQLQPGDLVEFLPGRYSASYSNPSTSPQAFHLLGIHGEADAPIIVRGQPGAVLETPDAADNSVIAFYIQQSSHVIVEGFEITGRNGGIRVADVENVIIRDNWIHDIDGVDNSNVAGIKVNDAVNLDISHNLIHDNYDRTNADTNGNKTENSRNVVLFASDGSVRFHHNQVFNSVPTDSQYTGGGITVKHGEDGSYEADHNIIQQAWHISLGTSTARSNIHHNLVVDSGRLDASDHGGAAYFNDIVFANNTVVSTTGTDGGGLNYSPHDCWYGYPEGETPEGCFVNLQRPIDSYNDIGRVAFLDNIVVDARTYNIDRATISISTYGLDRLYEKVIEDRRFEADGNVYFNPNDQVQFNVYNANGDRYGVKGAEYGLSGWRSLGFDLNGAVADPQFNQAYLPQNPIAEDAGWYADEGPRLTVLITGNDLISEGQSTQAVAVRSGDGLDLSQSLTVMLTSTDASEIGIPQSVTFAPGASTVNFVINATQDGENDGLRATRVSASADGFANNVSAWLRIEDSGGESTPGFTLLETGGRTEVSDSESSDSFSIVLDSAPMANVVFNVSSSDLSETTVSPATVTFNANNWHIPQAIAVMGVADGIADGDQTVTVTVSVDAASDASWTGLADKALTVVAVDDVERTDLPGFRDGILVLPGQPGEAVTLTFDFVERLGEYDNELGVFVANDINGTVNGRAPSDVGYAQTALANDSRRVIFTSGSDAGTQKKLTFAGRDRLVFYLVQNATTDELLNSNPNNNVSSQPVVFFSLVDGNPDDIEHVHVDEITGQGFRLSWEDIVGGGDNSFTDMVVDISFLDYDSDNADVDQRARALVHTRGFNPGSNSFYNWGGRQEEWISGNDGWFFITPDGAVYKWDGSPATNLTGVLVEQLDSRYHQEPALFFAAPSGKEGLIQLDRDYEFAFRRSYSENWGGLNEKWIYSQRSQSWFFITPDGGLHEWDRSQNSDLAGSRIARLNARVHTRPELLYDAAAIQVDQTLGLESRGTDWHNWLGLGERWMQGADDWYYITGDGGLYRWNGERQGASSGTFLQQLGRQYHADIARLFNAFDNVFADWNSLE